MILSLSIHSSLSHTIRYRSSIISTHTSIQILTIVSLGGLFSGSGFNLDLLHEADAILVLPISTFAFSRTFSSTGSRRSQL